MIRTYNKQTVVVENGVTKYLADIFCNSTDTKPTANLVNGSKLTEVDTGKSFLYDEANTEWVEYAAGGGGGLSGIGHITFDYVLVANNPYGSPGVFAYHTNAPEVYREFLKEFPSVTPGAKCESTSIIIDPIRQTFEWCYVDKIDNEGSANLDIMYKVNEDGTVVGGSGEYSFNGIGYLYSTHIEGGAVAIEDDGSVWYYKSGT